MFSISFRKHRDEKKENNLLTLTWIIEDTVSSIIHDFDYQNVNSLCSRYHYVNSAR